MKHGYPSFQQDIVECAKLIKEYCDNKLDCVGCPFYTKKGFCELREGYPNEWILETEADDD